MTNFILFCGILVIPVTTMSLFLSYNYGRPRNLESSPSDFANPEVFVFPKLKFCLIMNISLVLDRSLHARWLLGEAR